MSQSIINQIEDHIAAILRAGMVPWRKPWIKDPNCGFPRHIVSKRRYVGVNPALLDATAIYHRLASRWWGCRDEWERLGGVVRRNARPTTIVQYGARWKLLEVYNVDQVTGDSLDRYRAATTEATRDSEADWSCIDRIVRVGNVDLRFGGDGGFYFYPTPDGGGDYIEMPHKFCVFTQTSYYFTLCHELIHRTEPRLDWPSERDKAQDELVAEIGSGYLASMLGVPSDPCCLNHENHLDVWLASMQSRPGYFFRAAAQAMDAARYLVQLLAGRYTSESRTSSVVGA